MDQPAGRSRPYALQAGEGWTYRFGIDFTLKAGEVRAGSGAALCEYSSGPGDEPPDHTHATDDKLFISAIELGQGELIASPQPAGPETGAE